MTDRRVRQGDCISSLASDFGFHPDTIWNEPDNQELKAKREDSNVLHPNDVVTIPEKRTGEATGETGKRHSFRRKGRPERLRIICLDYEREPIRHTAYDLWIDGTHRNGTTDGEGLVDEAIPPDAKTGKLVVGENGDREEYKLLIGQLDPLDEVSGMQGRLANLGFDPGPIDGIHGPLTKRALERFQYIEQLERTGNFDAKTRGKLGELAEA